MTNERLKEIKDSIDFQKQYTIYKGFDMDLLQEEIDLYEEVVKLQERIDKAIEYLKDNHVSVNQLEAGTGLLNTKDYLLEILGDETK